MAFDGIIAGTRMNALMAIHTRRFIWNRGPTLPINKTTRRTALKGLDPGQHGGRTAAHGRFTSRSKRPLDPAQGATLEIQPKWQQLL
jgi:hypothetical protein